MGKWAPRKIEKCPTCGTILNPRDRVEKVLRESEEALKRYSKKMKGKKWNVGIVIMMLYGGVIILLKIVD